VIAEPVFALSTLNCTLATATSSVAFADKVTVPERVALATGEVIETVGGVVSPEVVQEMSPLTAVFLFASVAWIRQ
jgi:hypothetical protein